jgi:porin
MDLVPGAFVSVMAESRYGESVNGDAGALLPVNIDLGFPLTDEPDDNIAITVTELTYTQFLSEQFGVFVGKFQTLDGDANEFASGRGRSQFGNGSFVFNPVTVLTVPYSTLGGGVVWLPSDTITITSVVCNTADSSTTTGFGDFGDGWTWSTEAQFQYRLGDLPGGQVLTFIYGDDGEYANFSRVELLPDGLFVGTEDDSWAVTWSAWQYVYTPDVAPDRIDTGDGRADLRGLGLFARVGFADDDTNPIDLSISGGIGGRGLVPGRDDDTFGLGLSYADFDTKPLLSAVGFGDDGYVFEAFYNFDVGHGLSLTTNVQVLDPVSSSVGTTTVLGARFNVRF